MDGTCWRGPCRRGPDGRGRLAGGVAAATEVDMLVKKWLKDNYWCLVVVGWMIEMVRDENIGGVSGGGLLWLSPVHCCCGLDRDVAE